MSVLSVKLDITEVPLWYTLRTGSVILTSFLDVNN